jgi:FkbM family methyltransferase
MNRLIRALLPRTIKPHRVLGGSLRGATLVTSWHDYPAGILGRTERQLLDWFHAHVAKGQTWVDIGAHYGYTAIALARCVGPTGRVFAFEPVPATAACIERTRELNELQHLAVLKVGLGTPDTTLAVDLPLTRGMADRTIPDGPGAARASIEVARFDWLWPRISGGDETIHGIKIDVQGMELEVLRGMAHALRRHRPALVVEFHRGVDRQAVRDTLIAAGYGPNAEPVDGDHTASNAYELADDRSYAFLPTPTVVTP